MKPSTKFLALLLVFPSLLTHGQSQLVIDTDEFVYTAAFDQSRISKNDLRALLAFSPYDMDPSVEIKGQRVSIGFSQSPQKLQKGLIADSLEVCIDGDPAYLICGTRDISDPNFFANAEINVGRNDRVLAALDTLDVPAELGIVLRQFRDSMNFSSTLEHRRLEYLRSEDWKVLAQPVAGLDPLTLCGKEIEALKAAATVEKRYEVSRLGWHKCVNSEWNRLEPAYPMEAWKSFVRAYGIVEQYTPKSID